MYSIYMYCTFTFILALDVYACTCMLAMDGSTVNANP